MRTDERKDRHDEDNNGFSKFFETRLKVRICYGFAVHCINVELCLCVTEMSAVFGKDLDWRYYIGISVSYAVSGHCSSPHCLF